MRYKSSLRILSLVGILSAAALINLGAGERWQAHDNSSSATIDHGSWQSFLDNYVVADPSGLNRVKYRQVSTADRQKLGAYIQKLQEIPVSTYARPEQQAYWINLYNALTVELILDALESRPALRSIKDLSRPWSRPVAEVEGHKLSLNDIEHGILRPIWKDYRIHFAVNCASVGCPNLVQQAFTAENTEDLMEEGAQAFINSPRGARFEGQPQDQRLVVSSIFHWYGEDFGGSEGVLEVLRAYAEGDLAEALRDYDKGFGHDYDWSLND